MQGSFRLDGGTIQVELVFGWLLGGLLQGSGGLGLKG